MPELTPSELEAILDRLDDVCRQAQALQTSVRLAMEDQRRRDGQDLGRPPDRSKKTRGK